MYTTPQMPQESLPVVTKPFPNFWNLIKSTFHTWHDAWGIYSLINLAVVALGAVVSFLVIRVIPWIAPLLQGQPVDSSIISAQYPTLAPLVYDLVAISALVLFFMCSVILSQIMTIHVMNPETRRLGMRHITLISLRSTPGYIWTTAILSLIVIGGFILLVIPGLLLLPIVVTGIFVAAREHKTGLDAAVQSSYYVRGRVLGVLWRSLLILVIIQATSLILPVLAAFLVYPFTLFNFDAHTIAILSFTAGTLYTFVSLILSLVLPSLLIIFYYHLYAHMRDNPTNEKPLSRSLLCAITWFGALALAGIIALEIFFV